MARTRRSLPWWAAWLALFAFGCEEPLPSGSSYYDQKIAPIVAFSCVQQTTGCHVDLGGAATGNLDVGSYDALMRRRDTLAPYGPYPVGSFLLKGGGPVEVAVETPDPDPISGQRTVSITTDIRHAGGIGGLAIGSSSYAELKRWLATGHARNGAPRETPAESLGRCTERIGKAHGFDPSAAPADAASFERFRSEVQPILKERCAGSRCHGTPIADLHLTCGDSDEQLRWNYFVTVAHVTSPASTSELLRRPLSTLRGGTYHEGGDVFVSSEDRDYQTLLRWSESLVERSPQLLVDDDPDEGFRFFANRVQPVLVRKGCMFLNCHSPAMFHDLRLRGGSQGVFSQIATRRNYEMSLLQLGIESPDPNQGRIVAKNLVPNSEGGAGIAHRGGPLFDDFLGGEVRVPTVEDCASFDVDTGDLNTVPAYCVLARWHAIERERAIAASELSPEPLSAVVWVSRPPGVGRIEEFDTFRGGADLRIADATVDATHATTLGESRSLLGSCGLGASPDVRTPAVAFDGRTIAFAARSAASEPLRIYSVRPDGSACAPIAGIAPAAASQGGILLHDFDPAFAPDGRLVFVSTRGNLEGNPGPTRTPAALTPNANLYVADLRRGEVRQLTFLLNQELAPNVMADGRLIFTTEKREPEFHQFALRRQNLDGGDYHPLFAQRQSVGFASATEVVELPNRNLAFVAGPLSSPDGLGAILVANRSIGPDQDDRDPNDRTYIHAMGLPVAGAFGRIRGVPTGNSRSTGVFRSPAALPTGRILASCNLSADSLEVSGLPLDLCELDPRTGVVREVGGEAGRANVEAVAMYARPFHEIFESRMDEVNGASRVDPRARDAFVHVLDFPMMATLLFENTRVGRSIDFRIGGFEVLEALPPPASATSFAGLSTAVSDSFGQVHVQYRSLGFVPVRPDGSARVRLPGGVPLVFAATDGNGRRLSFEGNGPFAGEMIQREQMQFYPGERANQSIPRRFFNGLCGGCHGSITGRELDVAVDVDVLTGASRTQAVDDQPLDLLP